jgi:hypothetical protein
VRRLRLAHRSRIFQVQQGCKGGGGSCRREASCVYHGTVKSTEVEFHPHSEQVRSTASTRHLRDFFSLTTITGNSGMSLAELPLDVVLEITSLLDLPDCIRFLVVSRLSMDWHNHLTDSHYHPRQPNHAGVLQFRRRCHPPCPAGATPWMPAILRTTERGVLHPQWEQAPPAVCPPTPRAPRWWANSTESQWKCPLPWT